MCVKNDVRAIKNLLIFLAVIMGFAGLYVARDLLLPIVIGLFVALTLSPVVRGLGRLGIPAPVSAVTLILGAGLVLAVGAYLLSGPVAALLDGIPTMGVELRHKLRGLMASLKAVEDATAQVGELASGGNQTPHVALEQQGMLAFAAENVAFFMQLTAVGLVLAMFILASGDLFYVKLVETFPNFSDKRRAVRTARDVERRISHYFLTITMINAVLGLCVGVAMALVNLPSPILWGFLAFALNFLPFIGAAVGLILVAVFGILSFDTLGAGLLPAALYLGLTALEGQFVTPLVLGRRLQLNTVSVFLTVIVWSWLWSVPGALMAVPFLVLLKVVCDNVPGLSVLGNFLAPRASQTQAAAGS